MHDVFDGPFRCFPLRIVKDVGMLTIVCSQSYRNIFLANSHTQIFLAIGLLISHQDRVSELFKILIFFLLAL